MELKNHVKPTVKDKELIADVADEDLSQSELLRVYAVKITFTDVAFKQCNITSCYFRNCRFIRCDFTGAIIKETNLKGSQFDDCKFLYSAWDKTVVEESFQAVNKAASVEVMLNGQHLFNAAYSRQAYYRSKYRGIARAEVALHHARWKALDILWGNGESIGKLVGWGLLTVLAFAAVLWLNGAEPTLFEGVGTAASLFWGVRPKHEVNLAVAVSLTAVRYFLFGLFMAVLVKRLSRR
jgi:Pentapeptide repeats (8 copies)